MGTCVPGFPSAPSGPGGPGKPCKRQHSNGSLNLKSLSLINPFRLLQMQFYLTVPKNVFKFWAIKMYCAQFFKTLELLPMDPAGQHGPFVQYDPIEQPTRGYDIN